MNRLALLAVAMFCLGCMKGPAGGPPVPVATKSGSVVVIEKAEEPAGPAAEGNAPENAPPEKDYADRVKTLLEAAEKGRVSLILDLIKKGADINDKDDSGQTALHKAAAAGHKSMVIMLISLGADMGEKDKTGQTPLMVAAASGNGEVMQLFTSPGKISEAAGDILKSAGVTTPKSANELFNLFSGKVSSSMDVADKSGQTAWHKAAASGSVECVSALSSFGYNSRKAQLSRGDKDGKTPIMLAAAAGHFNVIEFLVDQYDDPLMAESKRTDAMGKTSLEIAEAAGHKKIVMLLHRAKAMQAAAEGDLAGMESCQKALGADFPVLPCFDYAVRSGRVAVVKSFLEKWKDKPAEEKLQLFGIPGDPKYNVSISVLGSAIVANQTAVIKLLLDDTWWNDPESLRQLINFKRPNSTTVYEKYYKDNYPEAVGLVEAKFKELDAKKPKEPAKK